MDVRSIHERPLLVVPIAGLEEKEYPFEFAVDAEEIGLEEFYEGEIGVRGTVSKVSSQFFVKGVLSAVRIGECDRCLTPTRESVEGEFALYYQTISFGNEQSDDESQDEHIRTLRPEEHAIVLDDEVRQSLRLHIPMKNLCREDCLGLCAQCGTNLNNEECRCEKGDIDPRWAKLAGLFNKEEDPDKN